MAIIPHEQKKLVKAKMYEPTGRWTGIIKKELSEMGREYQQLYELRCVRHLSENKICDIMHVERATYYKHMRDITENVWSAARENKLFNIREKIEII